ncbi:uncharacterized protein V1510DRAFT_422188 [Dipodascopsis tothii]|uniref:uncharacterized protein n=1 Tax=Dipodascopsis tothii TaxID=44089 RepID=UPI0034CE5158
MAGGCRAAACSSGLAVLGRPRFRLGLALCAVLGVLVGSAEASFAGNVLSKLPVAGCDLTAAPRAPADQSAACF